MLFKYGLPEHIDRSGSIPLILEQVDEAEKKRADFYDAISLLAVCLLIVGFLLQIASNYMPA